MSSSEESMKKRQNEKREKEKKQQNKIGDIEIRLLVEYLATTESYIEHLEGRLKRAMTTIHQYALEERVSQASPGRTNS